MTLIDIEQLLHESTGLDSESIGSTTVKRVVRSRMEAVDIDDIGAYVARLKSDPEELQALIDEVTVPETWFFRDLEPFQYFAEHVRRYWAPPSSGSLLRVLSLPCATGEEPYSIAMVLKELGFTYQNARIDAVDISTRALARARKALYGANSFRGDEQHYRDLYFTKCDDQYHLNEDVRRLVQFRHANLLDEGFLPGSGLYDVVFCRNLLIYFSRALQEKAMVKLHRLLAPNGILFVGHAEGGRMLGNLYQSLRKTGTFAFCKKDSSHGNHRSADAAEIVTTVQPPTASKASPATPSRGQAGKPVTKTRKPSKVNQAATPTVQANSEANPELDDVRRLADQGRLTEAASLCESYLRKNGVSAQAHYLMGLIRQAQNQESDAAEMYRRAVYLNPHHYEALAQLAAHAEAKGDRAAAAAYRARAARASGLESAS